MDDLASWLHALDEDGPVRSVLAPKPGDPDHFVDRALPVVPLARGTTAPAPLPVTGVLALASRRLTLVNGSARAVPVDDAPGVRAVVEGAALRAACPAYASALESSMPAVLLVGEGERWSDVARVAEALARAGYGPLHLALAAETRAARPPEGQALARFLSLTTNPAEMPWQRDARAATALAELLPRCPAVARTVLPPAGDNGTAEAQDRAFFADVPGAVRACACEDVDVAAVKAFAWTRRGRHWGPVTTTLVVRTARDDGERRAAFRIELPVDVFWRDALPALTEAARTGRRVVFVTAAGRR